VRDSIKRLRPVVHRSRTDKTYCWFPELGKLSRLEDGGYKLEGPIFATSNIDRRGIHRALDELMDRLDEGLEADLRRKKRERGSQ
jgi:hypothetical protein